MHKCIIAGALFIVAGSVFFTGVDAGYSLTPLITILEPSTGKGTGIVQLKFTGEVKVPVAVELKVKVREISENAEVVYKEDKSIENIIVYPSQVILMPDDVQRVQVQWAGGSVPDKEITYGLIAEEAPIDAGAEKAPEGPVGRLTIRTRYEAIVVIRPKGASPHTVVEKAEMKKDSTGSPLLYLTLHNNGTGMQTLEKMRLVVSPLGVNGKTIPGKTKEYRPSLTRDQTKHSLFAGHSRILQLPWPPGVPRGPVRVTVDFEGR